MTFQPSVLPHDVKADSAVPSRELAAREKSMCQTPAP
jgi:hypothetical protein